MKRLESAIGAELTGDPKAVAEHRMLDLGRNDIGRSLKMDFEIEVTKYMEGEFFLFVM